MTMRNRLSAQAKTAPASALAGESVLGLTRQQSTFELKSGPVELRCKLPIL